MGIGISYTNANGITSAFSAQGAGDAMSMLDGIIRQSESGLAALRAKRRPTSFVGAANKTREQREAERVARDEEQAGKKYARFSGLTYKQWKAQQAERAGVGGANPAGQKIGAVQAIKDFVKKIVGVNGAVEEKFNKLALRGESTARNGGIFGKSIRGMFGFFGFDSFDEPKVGRNISNAIDTDEDPQGGDKKANENVPWCEDFVTRIFVSGGSAQNSTQSEAPKLLKFAFRNRKITAGGREFALGEERVFDVCRLDNISCGSRGCYNLVISSNGTLGTLINQYYRVAGKTYTSSFQSFSLTDGIICLVIDITGSEPVASLATYSSISALQSAEANLSNFICPLYTIENGGVACDWRKGAIMTMTEF